MRMREAGEFLQQSKTRHGRPRGLLEVDLLVGDHRARLDAAVRNVHALGVPLTEAVAAATRVPARLLGRDDIGVLRPGAAADVVILDDRLDVRQTFVASDRHHAT
jgi:N-acetylglucosamine-6-phosphate deacetylase